jgi:hypothetical protein
MDYRNVSLSDQAYERLKKRKLPGESFNEVILREVPETIETCGDALDFFQSHPPPKINRKALAALREGRGRRSNRRVRTK